MSAVPNAVVITDRDGAIVWINPAFTNLTGYTLAESVGKNPRDLVKSGKQEIQVYRQLWETILAGRVWHGELVNRRKDGSLYFEEQTITPLCDADGRITHFVAIKQDLTERNRTRDGLRLFRSLIDHSGDAIHVIDPVTYRYLEFNESACRELGYTRAEFLKLTLLDVVVGRDRVTLDTITDQIRRQGSTTFETKHRRKDGSVFPVEVSLSLVALDHEYVVVVASNITERLKTQQNLVASELRYRRLFESAKDGILILDAETGMVVDVNPSLIELLGRAHAAFLGKKVWELGFFKDFVASQDNFLELQQKEYIRFEDKLLQTVDGRRIEVEFVSNVYLVNERKVIQCNIRDVTARKASERVLRDQNEIIANSHEAVMVVNLASEITFWNRGAEEIFGWSAAETIGQAPEKVLGIDQLGVVLTLRDTVKKEGHWQGELQGHTRDGRQIVLECRITLVCDDAGNPRGRLSFLSDITEKKRLERKFLQAQRLESIGMLAAGIAHDLNNMLAPIVFAGPLLRDRLSDPHDLKILDTVDRSAARCAALVKQILGFASNSVGERRPVQIKHLARDIISIVEETFSKSIRIEHQIPSDLWTVQSNAVQIHQVLLNLCVNARDAMPHGGTLRIAASNRQLDALEAAAIPGARPGAWLMLEVTDTGTGISRANLEQIWEPFFTTKSSDKGTGLGLSTVRGIVASHDGFIALETEVGRGTTFRVYLPAVVDTPRRPSSVPPFEATDGHGELILVVDDDAAIRQVVAAILEKHGYRAVCCTDGLDAITYFVTHNSSLSLVITDLDMPYLDGLDLARSLRKIRPELPILAMSGLSRDATIRADFSEIQQVTQMFLRKPFKSDDLLGTLHRMLHSPKTL